MTPSRTTDLGHSLCFGGAGLGAIGLIGWVTGTVALITIVPGQPPMMPNTALGLLLLGGAGAMRGSTSLGAVTRLLSMLMASFVLLLGLVTLAEYTWNLPFSIDELPFSIDRFLIRDAGDPYPGHQSPPTALAFVLLGAAIPLWKWRAGARIIPADWLIAFAGLIAFTAMIGQAFGVGALYRLTSMPIRGVAVHTALGLLLISVGMLLERPDSLLARTASSPKPGDIMLRRLALYLIPMVVLLGFVGALLSELLGIQNEALIAASLTAIGIVTGLSLLASTAESLNRTHDRLELALRGGDLATWDWNVKTGKVIYNRRWAELRGIGPEEIVPSLEAWSKGVHPEDWPTVQDRITDCFERAQDNFECEYRAATKSGEWIWVLDRGKVFERDKHGKPTRMAGTELDVTARRRAEQQLQRDLNAMTRLQKLGALSVQDGNLKPVLTEIVDAAIAISGSDFGNIQLLDPVTDDLHIVAQRGFPSWWIEFWNSVTKGKGACGTALARGGRVMVEDVDQSPIFAGTPALDMQHKVGVRSVQSVPLVSRSGKTIGMLSTHYRTRHGPDDHMFRLFDLLAGQAADIIEHAQARKALQLSEAKFSGIISISEDAIISIDENQCVTLFNEGAEKIFGRSRADMIGLPVDVLIPERFRAAHAREVEAFARGTEATRHVGKRGAEIFGLRSNGQEFPADAAISRIVVDGQRILTVALRDITELKEAEAEAKRATKAREDVLAIVAHDLRNPLTAIVGLAAILKRKAIEREIAEEIAIAAHRMNRLIGDLLEVTRIEAGRFSLRPERLPAAKLLSDALEGQVPLALAASLELHLDTPPELPDISADRDRVLQVFENLIGNAVKFTKPGGHITLGATVCGDDVLFSITDTGCGIPESHLPHIFDRFWQAPGASRREGLGFGLAIVKGIVESHHGRVWAESLPGRGSTFYFTIPIAKSAKVSDHPRPYQAARV